LEDFMNTSLLQGHTVEERASQSRHGLGLRLHAQGRHADAAPGRDCVNDTPLILVNLTKFNRFGRRETGRPPMACSYHVAARVERRFELLKVGFHSRSEVVSASFRQFGDKRFPILRFGDCKRAKRLQVRRLCGGFRASGNVV
jgi:hypothetical protein